MPSAAEGRLKCLGGGNYVEVVVDGVKYNVPQGLVNLLVKQALPAGVPVEHSRLYKACLLQLVILKRLCSC